MFPNKLMVLLTFTSILFVGVKCISLSGTGTTVTGETPPSDDPIPTNKCSYTLCLENTTCIAIPIPETCKPGTLEDACEKKAICIPHYAGKPAIYCGPRGERCSPDEKCDWVTYECLEAPCPTFLTCVPIIPNPGTRSGSTNNINKFSQFVVNNNNIYFHQRRKGRPQPGKHTSVSIGRSK